MTHPVKYHEHAWTEPFDTAEFESEVVLASDGETPLKVETTGPCPGCRGRTVGTDWVIGDVAGFLDTDDPATMATVEREVLDRRRSGTWSPPVYFVHQMVCNCTGEHTDAKPGSTGCGTYWALEVDLT